MGKVYIEVVFSYCLDKRGGFVRRGIFFTCILIILLIVISGCAKTSITLEPQEKVISEDIKTEEEKPAQETVATSPMKIEMSFSNAPALNQNAKITTTITYNGRQIENMPETIAQIILPDGFELIDGNLSWSGKVMKDEPVQFDLTVKSVKIGNWTIKANARSPPEGDAYIGGRDWIYISIFEDKGIISEDPFPLPKREDRDMGTKLNDSEISSIKDAIPDKDIIIPQPTLEGDEHE